MTGSEVPIAGASGLHTFPSSFGVAVIARFTLPVLVFLVLTTAPNAMAEDAPSYVGRHASSPEDHRAIEAVLSTYAHSVSTGNQAAFEALLLDVGIPFSSTNELVGPRADPEHLDTRRYPRFREAVFGSGKHYTQQFYNVHIEQDGVLAQASLDFVTREKGSSGGGYGFKTLQLVKVQGHWKIASEFYTAQSLPGSP
jgi:hypothetical protein